MFDESPSLKAQRLTRGFGEGSLRSLALRDLSLDLYAGQLAVLMGPSGSGKSTLLAILSGLLRPDGGRVLVRDRNSIVDMWSVSESERESLRLRNYGFIFQGYNLFPSLTAREQLEIVLRWGKGASRRDARRRADEMLDTLGLSHRRDARPAQLSGGEKQRVAIGRALVKEPTFCFADEPTAALDWKHGEQVIDLLRAAAHERGSTVLIVTHDSRILPFTDVAYHLEDGHLNEMEPALVGAGRADR